MKADLVGRGWRFPPRVDARGSIGLTGEGTEIEEAIRIILGTSPGERRMRPDFGCRIHELVFAPLNPETLGAIQRHVEEAVGRWEPRVELLSVDARPDLDSADVGRLLVEIRYRVKPTRDKRSLVYPFYVIGGEPAPEVPGDDLPPFITGA